MLRKTRVFSDFSVNDLQKANTFYGETLGLEVSETPEGMELHIAGGARIFVCPKPNHVKATSLADCGWDFAEVAQYVFASIQRGARERLEQNGTLASPKSHQNGVEWVFWAEQPKTDARE